MPELPEIETIRRSMLEVAPGPIRSLTIRRPDIVRQQDFPPERLTGKTWQEIRRRGKFLSFHFGEARVMTVHLGMSGRCYLTDSAPEETHVHLVILLEGGLAFIFQDPRRFGGIWFTLGEREQLALLGPEPLEAAFTELYLASILRRRKTAVKNILLNQRLLAGLGNIYADEALFAAGILPMRRGENLTGPEIKRLRQAVIDVLIAGIAARGTTFRDYRDGWNQAGSYQTRLQVYGRAGQTCRRCGGVIKSLRLGGRSSHYCDVCQV